MELYISILFLLLCLLLINYLMMSMDVDYMPLPGIVPISNSNLNLLSSESNNYKAGFYLQIKILGEIIRLRNKNRIWS